MKLTKDDPRLTAYAFGELGAEDTLAVAEAVRADAELAEVVRELLAVEALFVAESGADGRLLPEQRAAIYRASEEASNVVEMPRSSWSRNVVLLVGLAAAVVLTLTVLQRPEVGGAKGGELANFDFSGWSDSVVMKGASVSGVLWGEEAGASSHALASDEFTKASKLYAVALRAEMAKRSATGASGVLRSMAANSVTGSDNAWRSVQDGGLVRVPLFAGNASLGWVEAAFGGGKWPGRELVRAEELLNVLAVGKNADVYLDGASVAVDLVKVPWEPGTLFCLLDYVAQGSVEVESGIEFTKNVEDFRVLGYDGGSAVQVAANREMHAGESVKCAYALRVNEEADQSDVLLHVKLNTRSGAEQAESTFAMFNTPLEWSDLSERRKADVYVLGWSSWLKNPEQTALSEWLVAHFSEVKPVSVEGKRLFKVISGSLN